MGLAAEPVKRKRNIRVPVAEYIPDDDQEWLQEYRIELNAMITPQFIKWLSAKVLAYYRRKRFFPKVLPPADVLKDRLEQETRVAIERRIVDDVLLKANIPVRVKGAFAKLKRRVDRTAVALASKLEDRLKEAQIAHWTDIVKADAAKLLHT